MRQWQRRGLVGVLFLLGTLWGVYAHAGTCGTPTVIAAGGGTVTGTTAGASAETGSCGNTANGAEQVYSWTPTASGVATIETCGSGTTFDTVLYMRTAPCHTGAEVTGGCSDDACVNASGLNRASQLHPTVASGTTYYIVVDGYGSGHGDFSLLVLPPGATTTTTTATTSTTTTTLLAACFPCVPSGRADFRGVPKTAGFVHYLDGLPMSVVSQLGYVDRGIGGRGIFSFVDDFMGGLGGVPGDLLTTAPPPYRLIRSTAASCGLVGGVHYESGAVYLQAGSDDVPGTHLATVLAQTEDPFRYEPGRRLWASFRLKHAMDSDVTTAGWAFFGLTANRFTPLNTAIDSYLADLTNGVTGLYFYKAQGATAWSFAAVGDPLTPLPDPPDSVLADIIPITEDAWQLVSLLVEASGRIVIYRDGNEVATMPANNVVLTWLAANGPAAPTDGNLRFAAGIEGDSARGGTLWLDHVLVAEETHADAD